MMPSTFLPNSPLKDRSESANSDCPYLTTKGSSVGRAELVLAHAEGVARIPHPREFCKGLYPTARSVSRIPTSVSALDAARNGRWQESRTGRIVRLRCRTIGLGLDSLAIRRTHTRSTRTPFGSPLQNTGEPLRIRCAIDLICELGRFEIEPHPMDFRGSSGAVKDDRQGIDCIVAEVVAGLPASLVSGSSFRAEQRAEIRFRQLSDLGNTPSAFRRDTAEEPSRYRHGTVKVPLKRPAGRRPTCKWSG